MTDPQETKELDRQAKVFCRAIHIILLEAGQQIIVLRDNERARHSGITMRRMFVCIIVRAIFPQLSITEGHKRAQKVLRQAEQALANVFTPALGAAAWQDIRTWHESPPMFTLILPPRQQQRRLYAHLRKAR